MPHTCGYQLIQPPSPVPLETIKEAEERKLQAEPSDQTPEMHDFGAASLYPLNAEPSHLPTQLNLLTVHTRIQPKLTIHLARPTHLMTDPRTPPAQLSSVFCHK